MSNATEEQQQIILAMQSSKSKIILVDAVAGSGKTSTAQLVVNTLKPKRGLYTAFNKAIVDEGVEKFPSNISCKTLHALALSFVRPKKGVEAFTYLCIKQKLSYHEKKKIIDAIDEFYRSASVDIYEYLSEYNIAEKLVPIAIEYVEQMFNDDIPVTFNYLLKHFHLLLVEEQIDPKYDLVIIDEIQDSTAVALEIFKLLKCEKKLGLGDEAQSIYGFMNLVNGFELLVNNAIILPLSKSFRCSITIAGKIQGFCREYIAEDFVFSGTETPEADGTTAYITATNAQIIGRINKLHIEKKGYVLTRPLKEIFASTLAVATASAGKEVLHRQYKFLNFEYKKYTTSSHTSFASYLRKEVDDKEINSSLDLLARLRIEKVNIFQVLADAKKAKKSKSILVSTFFSCKGLGFETVYIEEDLNKAVDRAIEAEEEGLLTDSHHTTFKGYYVACSRARCNLHNARHLKGLI